MSEKVLGHTRCSLKTKRLGEYLEREYMGNLTFTLGKRRFMDGVGIPLDLHGKALVRVLGVYVCDSEGIEQLPGRYDQWFPECDIHTEVVLKVCLERIDPDSVYYTVFRGESKEDFWKLFV